MRGDHNDHFQATLGIHTGSVTFKRPSVGSWVTYGLGTENQNLPCYVVLAPEMPYAGSQVWSYRLPARRLLGDAHHQRPRAGPRPQSPRGQSPDCRSWNSACSSASIASTSSSIPATRLLDARIKTFETAFGMQMTMPQVLDLSKESDATLALYGLERGTTKGFAWQCLVARRMVEAGVRFVELIDVGSQQQLGRARRHQDARPAGEEHRPSRSPACSRT